MQFLTETFVELSKATAKVDKAYDSYQDERELLHVQAQFVGKVSIFQRGRRLVFSDRLFKVLAKDASKEPRIVHLFNDIIVYSIPRGKRWVPEGPTEGKPTALFATPWPPHLHSACLRHALLARPSPALWSTGRSSASASACWAVR